MKVKALILLVCISCSLFVAGCTNNTASVSDVSYDTEGVQVEESDLSYDTENIQEAVEEESFSPYDVNLHSVDSSCFYKIGYDPDYEKLVVVFNSNTDYMYVYSDFTSSDYEDFRAADSLGKYYNSYIKGVYPSEKYER